MIAFELIFVTITTLQFYFSIKRIMKSNANSVADYVIVTLYVMYAFPVFLDLIFGVPSYAEWFYKIKLAQENIEARIIYNFYVLGIMTFISLYSYGKNRRNKEKSIEYKSSKLNVGVVILIVLPIFHVLFSPYALNYILNYGTPYMRGVPENFASLNSKFILVSILFFFSWFFFRSNKSYDYTLITIYSLMMIWLNGKRNIILILIFVFIYFYNNSPWRLKHRVNLKVISAMFLTVLVLFSSTYLTETRGNVDWEWEELYTSFRIDFGRDDVTKFVIDWETLQGNSIHEYRGQGLLADLTLYIPRSIWEEKPFLHYRYLTSALVNINPESLHFGMTPSLLGQTIADFGIFGYLVSLLIILFFIVFIDKQKKQIDKIMLLMFLLAWLSMGIDYVAIYFILYMILNVYRILMYSVKKSKIIS